MRARVGRTDKALAQFKHRLKQANPVGAWGALPPSRRRALDPQQSPAEVARLVPKGVICLASALAVHGLTEQMPPQVWIAIERKDWRPRLTYPPIRIARFSDELLQRGVARKKIAGTPVPVFGVAKTVANLFRYRRTVGDALAIEGLRQALRQRKATPAEIARESEAAGVWATVEPCVMAPTNDA